MHLAFILFLLIMPGVSNAQIYQESLKYSENLQEDASIKQGNAESLKKNSAFMSGFLLSEIRSYSYDLNYVKLCLFKLKEFLKENFELSNLESELSFHQNQKLMKLSAGDMQKLHNFAKKYTDKTYEALKSERERVEFLYGSILSSLGLELETTGAIKMDPRLENLLELLEKYEDQSLFDLKALLKHQTRVFFWQTDRGLLKFHLIRILKFHYI